MFIKTGQPPIALPNSFPLTFPSESSLYYHQDSSPISKHMDGHHNPAPSSSSSFSWPPCFCDDRLQQDESMEVENLKQALVRTTLELESTRLVAQEELKKLESQSLHLAHLLHVATRERDEARHHCHSLLLLLSSSSSSPSPSPTPTPPPPPNPNPNPIPNPSLAVAASCSSSSSEEEEEVVERAVRKRGLPEKGRLVEAVMRAGPLLQTLLLAGPLPEWRHPPPAMKNFEIPPVSMMGGCDEGKRKKRGRDDEEEEEKRRNYSAAAAFNSGSSPESNNSSSKQLIGSFH